MQNLAVADAAGFDASDGMVARVETLWTLIRIWITIKPSKLYEDLGPAAVDALGLDPTKGVMVRQANEHEENTHYQTCHYCRIALFQVSV